MTKNNSEKVRKLSENPLKIQTNFIHTNELHQIYYNSIGLNNILSIFTSSCMHPFFYISFRALSAVFQTHSLAIQPVVVFSHNVGHRYNS